MPWAKEKKVIIKQSWARPKVVKDGTALTRSTGLRSPHEHQGVAQGTGVSTKAEAGRRPGCGVLPGQLAQRAPGEGHAAVLAVAAGLRWQPVTTERVKKWEKMQWRLRGLGTLVSDAMKNGWKNGSLRSQEWGTSRDRLAITDNSRES